MGFAILKFSTSPKIFGKFARVVTNISIVTNIVILSFTENIGWNFILSMFVALWVGLEDPFWWSKIKCIRDITEINIGNMKCNEKNRLRVGWEMAGPPHSQMAKSLPKIGIAVNTPVITVAPQNDIWPQGRT